jgi:hypothetical protein
MVLPSYHLAADEGAARDIISGADLAPLRAGPPQGAMLVTTIAFRSEMA